MLGGFSSAIRARVAFLFLCALGSLSSSSEDAGVEDDPGEGCSKTSVRKNDDDEITLCPCNTSGTLRIRKDTLRKINKDGLHFYAISYFCQLESKSIIRHMSEDDFEETIKRVESECNNMKTIITIKKKQLTPHIIKHFRYVQPCASYPSQNVLISPYILGLWLGDGFSRATTLTNIDIPLIQEWKKYADELNCTIVQYGEKSRKTKVDEQYETPYVASYRIKGNSNTKNILLKHFQSYNLIENKHIPKQYLKNDEHVRLQLLAGIIDTDGSLSGQQYEIIQKSLVLSNNIVTLSKSLGFYTRMHSCQKSCKYKNEVRVGTYYRIHINLNQFSKPIPVRLNRKEWKYNGQIIHNPKIDINGNIIVRNERIIWTDELKYKLYSIVTAIKHINNDDPIDWNVVKAQSPEFSVITIPSLQSQYYALINDVNFDKSKSTIIHLTEYDILDVNFKKVYEEIKTSLDSQKYITMSQKKLYNWLHNCHYGDYQKLLVKQLLQKQNELIKMHEEIVFKSNIDELDEYLLTHKKTPIEGTSLGNWLKGVKRGNHVNSNSNNARLWNELVSKHTDIIKTRDETWLETLENISAFIKKKRRRPTKQKHVEEKTMSTFLDKILCDYNADTRRMSSKNYPERREKFEAFLNEHASIFKAYIN